MSNIKCSYCGGEKFYTGPSGGLSTNILCANKDCRHWFNSTPIGLEDLKRVEPTDKEKEKIKNQREKEMLDRIEKLTEEGKNLFAQGKCARKCFKNDLHTRVTKGDIFRLCGYIDKLLHAILLKEI